MDKTTHVPKVQYRVLATDWEGESYIECWTVTLEAGKAIETALKGLKGEDVSVQIDKVERGE